VHLYPELLTLGNTIGGFRILDAVAVIGFFILLLVILKKLAWGPLMNVMEERENFVANEIEVAEKYRADSEVALKEAQAELQKTRAESQQMIEDAKAIGIKQSEEIVQTARDEAERMKTTAQADIQSEKERAVQALQEQVASLSVLIASKVIEKEIGSEDHENLIADYIKEVGEER